MEKLGRASTWGKAANHGGGTSTCSKCGCTDLLVDIEGVEVLCPQCLEHPKGVAPFDTNSVTWADKDALLEDRVKTLKDLSGLVVECRKEKGKTVFEFYTVNKVSVKTCFTYPKAKLFAEGVAYGRRSLCGT